MTWYAHHIFAQSHEAVLATFTQHPHLRKSVYWIHSLPNQDTSLRQHALPEPGLVVVRPVGPVEHADWYLNNDERLISWSNVIGANDVLLHLSPDKVLQESDYPFPPNAFLRYLKALSQDTNTTIAYYVCETWGGIQEMEYRWVFTPHESIEPIPSPRK
jgi:hypothetical protein